MVFGRNGFLSCVISTPETSKEQLNQQHNHEFRDLVCDRCKIFIEDLMVLEPVRIASFSVGSPLVFADQARGEQQRIRALRIIKLGKTIFL